MIGCLQTHVPKYPIIALYFESETVLKFFNLAARTIPGLFSFFKDSISLPLKAKLEYAKDQSL